MTETLTVRFVEYERYSIELDCREMTYMAMTDVGSYFCHMPYETPKDIREGRKAFQDHVLACMAEGIPPKEVFIGDSPEALGDKQ